MISNHRTILHFNIDCFAASVEQAENPDLRGKPVIIGRSKGSGGGVVISESREAKSLGVQDGMSVRQAQRVCPDAHILIENYALYKQVFDDFLDILADYSPLLEPETIGSAYLDVTASRNLFGNAGQISSQIYAQFSKRLPLFIGCASNKLTAKAASGMGKRFVYIKTGSEAVFLSSLPIDKLDVVNDKMKRRLNGLGVTVIGQLAAIPERLLIRQFGPLGSVIKKQSLGIDLSPVKMVYPVEVIKIEHGFDKAIEEPAEIEEHLKQMAGEVGISLRKKSLLTGEITLVLYDESGAHPEIPIPACFRFKSPTDSVYGIVQALEKLLMSKIQQGMRIVRIRIILSDLTCGTGTQMCLIGSGERNSRLDRAVEVLRERFGEKSVFPAALLAPEGRARTLSRIAAG